MYPESYMEAHGQTALVALIDLSGFPAYWQNNQGDFLGEVVPVLRDGENETGTKPLDRRADLGPEKLSFLRPYSCACTMGSCEAN